MKTQKFITLIIFLNLIIGVNLISAQTWNLPNNRSNTRFTSDHFNIPRPALAMRSFDNTKNDGFSNQYSSTTYGVRQVLEKAYGIGQAQIETTKRNFEQIIIQSNLPFKSFTSDNAEENSSILESKAFVNLLSYIIKKNPTIFTASIKDNISGMPSHTTALTDFINALRGRGDYFRDSKQRCGFQALTATHEGGSRVGFVPGPRKCL